MTKKEIYWYVLFTRTGREESVKLIIKKRLDINLFTPIIPMSESLFKVSGQIKKETKPLFPSYVFVKTELPCMDFVKMTSELISSSSDIIRLLRYDDIEIAMRESEKQTLLNLCNDKHCVETSVGIIEGDRISIINGPLKGFESNVKKVNRHKRQAWIEVEFMGNVSLISVPLEIVEKI